MLCSSRRYAVQALIAIFLFAFVIFYECGLAVDRSATRREATIPPRLNKTIKRKPKKEAQRRLREGTNISSESGFFRLNGDGAIFISEEGYEFGGLPNLNLERVVILLKNAEDPKSVRWTVSGTVTEFSDRNFLLISRAIYKSIAQPPLPEQLH